MAAMIELGVAPDLLKSELGKLNLDHEFELKISQDSRKGIHGTKVDVVTAHDHHDHDGHHHAHQHRNLADIESIIQESGLSRAVKDTSLAIFMNLAKAEAKVHGKDIHEIHFHEVGATDAIVDIVGAAICHHTLDIDQVWSSPVELGGGFVNCAHGKIPVPAPATVEILTGCPSTRGAVQKETTTPTGAAILKTLVNQFTATPAMSVTKTAYGIGHRDNEIPNVLRVNLARTQADERIFPKAPGVLLECNIDDMTGEMLGHALDELMAAGAMDVHFTPIVMKKNRPATTLSVLCGVHDQDKFKELIFRHTTTLGLKAITVDKTALETSFEELETPLGTVRMKNAIINGKVARSKPEFEDCVQLSKKHGIPLAEVYLQIGKVRKT